MKNLIVEHNKKIDIWEGDGKRHYYTIFTRSKNPSFVFELLLRKNGNFFLTTRFLVFLFYKLGNTGGYGKLHDNKQETPEKVFVYSKLYEKLFLI